MILLLNVTLAWLSVGLLLALSVIYLLRMINKKFYQNAHPTLTKWHKVLRKPHKWLGISLIITSLLHGVYSSTAVLSINLGSVLLVVFVLLGLTYMFRKYLNKFKSWMVIHRYLTGFAFALLFLHIIEVGGLVGVDNVRLALENDPWITGNEAYATSSTTDTSDADAQVTTDSTTAEDSNASLPSTDSDTTQSTTTADENPSTDNGEASLTTEATTTSSGPYIDGTYQGTARGYRPDLTVEVVVSNGLIASVEVISHNEKGQRFYGKPIAEIPDAIVAAQSTDVDGVSGATFTSNGIKDAVDAALADALK